MNQLKYIYLLSVPLLLTGCFKSHSVEFTGTTPGIKNGVFIIKTTGDSTVYGENIKDGKFTVTKKPLKYPGYYLMNITDADSNDTRDAFEIYLEGGQYTIETEPGKLYKYPKVTSSSKIQEQLSAFYTLSDRMSADAQQEAKKINEEIKIKGNGMSQLVYTQLLNKLGAAENKVSENNINTFRAFVKQYPNSEISAHIMSKLNYDEDPVSFYEIYNTLSPEAKNSDEGKEIGEKLSHLVKLVDGAPAPAIYGKTALGKPFDQKSINKPLILIDFWRASNEISRKNHQTITDLFGRNKDAKNLAVISVSLDTKYDWWITAVNDDHMNWTQVSDLKGDDSPNAANWNISQIPTYYLLDNNWKIVKQNMDFGQLEVALADYAVKHH